MAAIHSRRVDERGEEERIQKAVICQAGCPVCVGAESKIAEIVNLGESKGRVEEARVAGEKSVPALVVDGGALHIDHGADLADLS